MFRQLALTAAAALGLASTASAQVHVVLTAPGPAPVVVTPRPVLVVPQNHYHVQYRLPWQERIFLTPYEARAFELRQQALGYTAYTVCHGHDWHVRYRLPGWQTYRTVHSDFLAHRLERHLELQGFDARVVHD